MLKTDRRCIPSFAAVFIAMMAIQMSSLGFSPLLLAIQKDFGLTYSQIGLFTGLYGLVAMAVPVPAGILAKRVGEKLALSAGRLRVALGLLLLSQASSYQGALGARVRPSGAQLRADKGRACALVRRFVG